MLRDLRSFISRRNGAAVLLGEVNLVPDRLIEYFGVDGDEIHMLTDFPLMQATYLALARENAQPVVAALRSRPDIPEDSHWANFVRNHDELTLDLLSPTEREEVFAVFGPEDDMRIYDRGIRRRLPPMLGGDPQRIRLAYSLLLSLPGTPVLLYGEEIGMGENLEVEGRLSVRTPMQWSDEPAAGFSTTSPSKLFRRPTEGPFGPLAVNVSEQRRQPDSLLTWMEATIRRRRESPEFGWGDLQIYTTSDDAVMAHGCVWEESRTVAVHNFSNEPTVVIIDLGGEDIDLHLDDLLEESPVLHAEKGRLELKLDGYGYRWFRTRQPERPLTP